MRFQYESETRYSSRARPSVKLHDPFVIKIENERMKETWKYRTSCISGLMLNKSYLSTVLLYSGYTA